MPRRRTLHNPPFPWREEKNGSLPRIGETIPVKQEKTDGRAATRRQRTPRNVPASKALANQR